MKINQFLLNRYTKILAVVLLLLVDVGCWSSAKHSIVEPQLEPAIPAILALFDTYRVVGLSELHANQEEWDFIDDLVRNSTFATKVNDITFEGGNVRYQNLVDRYIAGEAVSLAELQQVWRNNTQANTTCDAPVYMRFFSTIREVNQNLPESQRLRVILLDPPIDWSAVHTRADWDAASDREPHMVSVIEREVYAKDRKVLFIAGGAHLARGGSQPVQRPFPQGGENPRSSVDLVSTPFPGGPLATLEQRHPDSTFVIGLHEGFDNHTDELEPRLDSWPKASLAQIKGTWIGELPASGGDDVFISLEDGKPVNPYAGLKMQDIFDALLYLGRRATLTRSDPTPVVRGDQAWLDELDRRHRILHGVPLDKSSVCTSKPKRYFP